jgi:TRAP-type uncharacterized transport system substrate-binding protein
MFLRHTWLVTLLGTILLAAVISLSIYYFTMAAVMRIATGPDDSANAKFVQVLEDMLVKDDSKIRLQLVPTRGAQASAKAMSDGQADLAIMPSTVGNSINWPVVAILRQNVMAFIVPAPAATNPADTNPGAAASQATNPLAAPAAGAATTTKKSQGAKPGTTAKTAKSANAAKSAKTAKTTKTADSAKADKASKSSDDDDSDDDSGKFTKISQLVDKRVGIVTGNEASTNLLDVVLNHYGVPVDRVQVSSIDPKDVAAAVKANQVDALFVAGSSTGQAISNAVAAASQNGTAPTYLEIDQADGIAKRNPAFDSIDIDAGTFGGNPPSPDDSLKSLSFAEYLVAQKAYDHGAIATLAKVIYTSRNALAAAMTGEVKIKAPSTDKDGDVTVDAGALAYLSDSQQSFFDKYGDDIFYGLLIFPIFGSAIAGLASYLHSDSRTRRLRLLQRVLDLVRKVHVAQALETIEQLQIDADDLVIRIIHLSEHEEFDETVRMSFSFALDQLRFAIAARRTAILDHGTASAAAAA